MILRCESDGLLFGYGTAASLTVVIRYRTDGFENKQNLHFTLLPYCWNVGVVIATFITQCIQGDTMLGKMNKTKIQCP